MSLLPTEDLFSRRDRQLVLLLPTEAMAFRGGVVGGAKGRPASGLKRVLALWLPSERPSSDCAASELASDADVAELESIHDPPTDVPFPCVLLPAGRRGSSGKPPGGGWGATLTRGASTLGRKLTVGRAPLLVGRRREVQALLLARGRGRARCGAGAVLVQAALLGELPRAGRPSGRRRGRLGPAPAPAGALRGCFGRLRSRRAARERVVVEHLPGRATR
jgi:hypothetical protein